MNPSLKTDFAQLWVFPQPVKPRLFQRLMYGLKPVPFKNAMLTSQRQDCFPWLREQLYASQGKLPIRRSHTVRPVKRRSRAS